MLLRKSVGLLLEDLDKTLEVARDIPLMPTLERKPARRVADTKSREHDPHPVVRVLADPRTLVEPADSLKNLLPDGRGGWHDGGVSQIVILRQAWAMARQPADTDEHALIETLIEEVDIVGVDEAHDRIGKGRNLFFNLAGSPNVVTIQESDQVAGGFAHRPVAGNGQPSVLLSDQMDASCFVGKPLELLRGSVGRAIIHDDDLLDVVSRRLAQHTSDSLFDEGRFVVAGDANGDSAHVSDYHDGIDAIFRRQGGFGPSPYLH
jgi:hypothetical protein